MQSHRPRVLFLQNRSSAVSPETSSIHHKPRQTPCRYFVYAFLVVLTLSLSVAANDDITKALTDKKITDDQAKKLRDGLAAEINTFVDRTWPAKLPVAPRAAVPNVKAFLGDMLQAARDYLGGVTLQDVTTAMRNGKSLGDIATDKGKTRDGLVLALTTAANANIDKAVASNKLTAEQAATLRAKVSAEIATFVDRKAPAKTTTNRTTTKTP